MINFWATIFQQNIFIDRWKSIDKIEGGGGYNKLCFRIKIKCVPSSYEYLA